MKDVIIQQRIVSELNQRKSKEAGLFEMLGQSLNEEQQLLNKGIPIFKAKLQPISVETGRRESMGIDDIGLIGSPPN